ncbi:2-oxoacid:acceptor oxidoreductase subunit alpha, partial [Patescibacteria group bacterium]|nr:2-oxoacid:acceptor oxidoreductase subunit alpha [Patescibacteria group bacterium]
MKNFVTWKIGGEAGFGIMVAGTMLTKAFSRRGYHTIASNEYPSLIRGGHNVITVGIGIEPFFSLHKTLDILVALNKETIEIHKNELHEGSFVVFDPKEATPVAGDFSSRVERIALPLSDLVQKLNANVIMRNTVALGATIALLGADFSILSDVIETQFEKKGKTVIDENIAVAKAGYDAVKTTYGSLNGYYLSTPKQTSEQLVMNGSEAVGIGALDGGMKFAAIYPMTPINALITLFADHKKELGITYIQPEDEIAGINMAIGASLAGVRSMVATSGGGFSLMVEGLSLLGVIEVPLVIDLGMRPGPATGMPTWTEQGELLFSVFSGHGEFPRIILAPGDVTESYLLSRQAFDLASLYQIPVFILTDKYLNENQWCVDKSVFDAPPTPQEGKRVSKAEIPEDFKRYDVRPADGVSKRSFPGMEGGLYIANSYEHDEKGFTTEDPMKRTGMADKRLKKLKVGDFKKMIRQQSCILHADRDKALSAL